MWSSTIHEDCFAWVKASVIPSGAKSKLPTDSTQSTPGTSVSVTLLTTKSSALTEA